ncbi:hypothetical protein F5888DRAFT_1634068 [Russula emetica]|nr:hypothetical protein F5888DRAFT_1634068 [Russula emetica]
MSAPLAPPDVVDIAAPLLFGVLWNWTLYGVLVVQIFNKYVYSYNFPDDRKLLKLLATGGDVYYWSLSGFGKVDHLRDPYASAFDNPIMGRAWWYCVIIVAHLPGASMPVKAAGGRAEKGNSCLLRAVLRCQIASKFGKTGAFGTGPCDFGGRPVLKPELLNGALHGVSNFCRVTTRYHAHDYGPLLTVLYGLTKKWKVPAEFACANTLYLCFSRFRSSSSQGFKFKYTLSVVTVT